MFLQTKTQKAILALIGVLLLITVCKDWLDFYRCGAVGQCLVDACTLQYVTKFAISWLLTMLAFIVSRDSFSRRDAEMLRLAFIFSLLADFCFTIFKGMEPGFRSDGDIFGIAFFTMFQTVLIYRHTRKSESDIKPAKVHFFLIFVVALAIALFAARVIEFTPASVTIAIVVVYAFFLISSLVLGILASRRGYFPETNAKFIRWGMIAFFIGDALVGLALIPGEDHSAMQAVSEISNNFVWWAYVPAQLMLIRSTAKPQA